MKQKTKNLIGNLKEFSEEIICRVDYFYRQTDGSLKYPDGQVAQLCEMITRLNNGLSEVLE